MDFQMLEIDLTNQINDSLLDLVDLTNDSIEVDIGVQEQKKSQKVDYEINNKKIFPII